MSHFENPVAADRVPVPAHPAVRGACTHEPRCPDAAGPDRDAAHVIACHPEQGWSLLCNGIVLFDDTGELLPDGQVIPPHRPTDAAPHRFGFRAG